MKTKLLLKAFSLLFILLCPGKSLAQLHNDYGYQGTVEVKVGETKYVALPTNIQSTLSLGYLPSGKWVLSNNFSNASMVSSSMSGCKIKGVKKGDDIKLTFSGNCVLRDASWSYSGYFLVKVTEASVSVSSVSVSPTSASLKVGETKQLSATVSPSNATNKSVSWSTSSSSIATVSSSGLVTAKAAGNATITCKATDGSGKQATCNVSVSAADPIKVTEVKLNYTSTSLMIGDTRQLYATITPSNATNKTVTWSSSKSSVAEVSNSGLVTAKGRGTATITCKANDGSGKQATCEVTVSSVKNYSIFTAKTVEGVEMQFYVSKTSSGVCEVYGYSSNTAIDKNTTGKITIPSEVEGLKVTEISPYAFDGCAGITEVNIPSSVEEIGGSAFSGCSALTKVSLGNGVKRLGNSAFNGCTSLTTITGINQLEYIDSNAFGYSDNYIPWYNNLPDGLLYIGKVLYKYKGTMPEGTKVDIKEGTTQIGHECFYNCTGLVGVTVPQSLSTIGNYAFEGCSNLSSISVASGNPKYDSRNNCNAIIDKEKNILIAGCKSTTFPSTVTAIGSNAFYRSGPKTLIIPNSIDSIASSAFAYNDLLESIAIGKGTRKIVDNPFIGCINIKSIGVASGNPYYDSRDNCNAIIEKSTNKLITGCPNTVIPATVKVIGQNAFHNYSYIYSLSLTNVERIEKYAFEYLSSLRSLLLGKNIKEIEKSAFYGCSRLRIIRCLADEPTEIDESVFNYYSSNPDSIYNSATLYVPIGSKINYMTSTGWSKFKKIVEIADDVIPEGTVFNANTIEGATLTFMVTDTANKTCELIGSPSDISGKVTIPAQPNGYYLTSIGNSAFYSYNDERRITEVIIPEGVTTIGDYAFESRHKTLSKISLPNTLTTIGIWAFEYCPLKSFVLPASVTSVGRGIVGYIPELTSLTVESGNTVYDSRDNCNAIIETSTNTLIAGCTTTKIPESVTTIGMSAFSGSGLVEITIPASIDSISNYAFGTCKKLEKVYSRITEPFDVDSLVFSNWNADERKYYFTEATLYVPKGTKAKYQAAGGWKYFSNIVEGENPNPEPTLKGDVNEDEKVNGTDLVALTNIILGKNPEKATADVNSDGKVNGTDYVALANIILGKTSAARQMTRGAEASGLSIEPFSIKAGEEQEMIVNLTNPNDAVTLVQFDLSLPTGLSLKKVDGEYDFDMAGRTTWRKHSLDANAQADGTIRFLLASSSNATLSGTEGAIIKMILVADDSFTTGDIKLKNILTVTPEEKEIAQGDYTYHIGGSTPEPPTPETTTLAIEPLSIKAGSETEMVIDLTNPNDEITLVQFDLSLPTGLSLKNVNGEYDFDIAGRTTWRKHSLDANAQADGTIRFLLASSSNTTLSGTEGAIIKMTLVADNSFTAGDIKINNILLVTPDEKEITPSNIIFIPTAIQEISITKDNNAPIYNLSGQKLKTTQKGINIVGGKKVIVK